MQIVDVCLIDFLKAINISENILLQKQSSKTSLW